MSMLLVKLTNKHGRGEKPGCRMSPMVSRRLASFASVALALQPRDAATAWCGSPYPPFAYSLPWFEFPLTEGVEMRVVGVSVV